MRVALICPRLISTEDSFLGYPLGLAYLAHAVRGHGHKVCILDQAEPSLSSPLGLLASVKAFDPDIVGLTANTTVFPVALDLALRIKAALPCVKTVFGGNHTSGDPSAVDEDPIDMIVRGEGEHALVEILDALAGNRPLEEIRGVSYKEGEHVRHNPDRERIESLEDLGFPSREDLKQIRYCVRSRMIIDIPAEEQRLFEVSSARGCPFGCIFCQAPVVRGSKWVARSAEHVVDEIQLLYAEHQANVIGFSDDNFSFDPLRVEEICELLLERNIRVSWYSTARAADITSDLARTMYAAGCRSINVGIETYSNDCLDKLNKSTTTEEIRTGVTLLRNAGIKVLGTVIIGFPWESAADLEHGLCYLAGLPIDYLALSFAVPFSGTPLNRMAEEEGLIFDRDLTHWTGGRPVMRTRYLSAEDLSRYRDRLKEMLR